MEKQADVLKIPIADGGEGTVDAIIEGCGGEYRYITVTGPYQQMVQAKFGLIDTERAVIEMAQASGLMLVGTNQMNPMEATSYGTGELINEVLAHGVKRNLYRYWWKCNERRRSGYGPSFGSVF